MAKTKNSAHHNGKIPVVFGDVDRRKEVRYLLRPPSGRIYAEKIPIEQPIIIHDNDLAPKENHFGSELERLIDKQILADLTRQDIEAARTLITNPSFTSGSCWTCEELQSQDQNYNTHPEIYNTGYCQIHAKKVLEI